MRLQRYLNEKYFGTVRTFTPPAGDYEIFVNPSKKEMREATDEDGGYRYIIDFKRKKVWMWNANAIHMDIFNVVDEIKPDDDLALLFTGDFDGKKYNSDTLNMYDEKDAKALLNQDWKWVDRYLDAKAIQYMIKKQMR
jgi:hypothetical protein